MSVIVRDREKLNKALISRFNNRVRINGEMLFPCVPSLIDTFVRRLAMMWASLGKPFDLEEIAEVRTLLEPWLIKGFAESPHNRVKVSWQSDAPPSPAVNYQIELLHETMAEQYEYWVATKAPPLFGKHPDARVMALAAELPPGSRIADLGAGTGRNSVALAVAGHTVDAVEATHSFVEIIQKAADEQGVAERVTATFANLLDDTLELPEGAYQMVVLSEVVTHFRGVADLRKVFVRANRMLAPGGFIVLNSFMADDGYYPDQITTELSQIHWSWIVTRDEFDAACMELPLRLHSDDVLYSYEKERLPDWPPTGWFESWTRVRDVYAFDATEDPPVQLRWLVYRKHDT